MATATLERAPAPSLLVGKHCNWKKESVVKDAIKTCARHIYCRREMARASSFLVAFFSTYFKTLGVPAELLFSTNYSK